jgi:hypothetical protein
VEKRKNYEELVMVVFYIFALKILSCQQQNFVAGAVPRVLQHGTAAHVCIVAGRAVAVVCMLMLMW